MITYVMIAMGIGRVLLGLAPFVAAATVSSLLGFPPAHDTPTARLMARWFGVRDVGLGVLMFWALTVPTTLPFILIFQALTDFADAFAIAIPLVRRQGIDRAAWSSLAFALPAGLTWLAVFAVVR